MTRLYMQGSHRVLNMAQYASIMPEDTLIPLNMHDLG